MKKTLVLTTLLLVLLSCKEPKQIKRGATQEFPHCPVFLQMINVDLFRKEIPEIVRCYVYGNQRAEYTTLEEINSFEGTKIVDSMFTQVNYYNKKDTLRGYLVYCDCEWYDHNLYDPQDYGIANDGIGKYFIFTDK